MIAKAIAGASACPLLAQLAKTGETVAKADVTDPGKFNATLRSAVDEYVRTARRLRGAVPLGLRADVERLLAAGGAVPVLRREDRARRHRQIRAREVRVEVADGHQGRIAYRPLIFCPRGR